MDELGWLALVSGAYDEAKRLCEESLAIRRALGDRRVIAISLSLLGNIVMFPADRGEPERAVQLYALASRYPFVAKSRWFEDVAGRHIAAAATTLPPEVVAAAQARGRDRDLDATAAELSVQLEEE